MTFRPPAFMFLPMLACVAILTLAAGNANAAGFQVSPVRLELSARASSALLNVRNQSNEPIRFQVTGFAWKQSEGGEVRLLPTKDISFFPSMLIVPPGGSRKVRVGALTPPGASEQTYRVIVEQLPSLQPPGPAAANTVRVLTKMSIPVFLAALAPTARPSVEGLTLSGGHLSFLVRNRGNTHLMNRTLHLVTTDSADQVTYDKSAVGWYVLGAGTRRYNLALPATACKNLSKVTVEVDTDKGPARATVSVSPSQCLP